MLTQNANDVVITIKFRNGWATMTVSTRVFYFQNKCYMGTIGVIGPNLGLEFHSLFPKGCYECPLFCTV